MKKLLIIAVALIMAFCTYSCRASPSGSENGGVLPPITDAPEDYGSAQKMRFTRENTVATDALGRSYEACAFNDNKQVGMFYFLWSGSGAANHDISKQDESTVKSGAYVGEFHYWSEPLYGYYHSGDPWVFFKHLEMFAAIGIDYIMFDATNGYIYEEVLDSILPVALDLHNKGYYVPKFAFYCNASSRDTVTALYDGYYKKGTENGDRYADLWYRWKDTDGANADAKPWIVARVNGGNGQDYGNCRSEIRDFFYLKEAQWPNEGSPQGSLNYPNGMPWMSWADGVQHNHNGIMSVSVAQHTSGAFSDAVLENNRGLGRGRGYNYASGSNDASQVNSGLNYEWQWNNAIENSGVNNVFITGFNEWIAQKQSMGEGRSSSYFVDLYNCEFSRDIEMTKGGYGDNFLLQTARNIRRFKGGAASGAFGERTITKDGDISQWNATACYIDPEGDTAARSYVSSNRNVNRYELNTGRNDITSVRVAHDGDYLYFKIECAKKLQPYTAGDKSRLNLFIEVDGLSGSNWNGYQYVVNRNISGGVTYVERLSADGSSQAEAAAEIWQSSKYITVKIARKDVCATGGCAIKFKVADNVTDYADITDYYVNGDSAPIGRLSYSYRIK